MRAQVQKDNNQAWLSPVRCRGGWFWQSGLNKRGTQTQGKIIKNNLQIRRWWLKMELHLCVLSVFFLIVNTSKSYLPPWLLRKRTPGFFRARLDLATGCLQRLVAETGWAFFLVRLLNQTLSLRRTYLSLSEIIKISFDFELSETHL